MAEGKLKPDKDWPEEIRILLRKVLRIFRPER
jgi:hypothetical protein